MRETFFQICIYFTLCLLAVSLCINFVSAVGIYGDVGSVDQNPGVDYDEGKDTILPLIDNTDFQGNTIDTIDLWAIAGVGTIVGTVFLGILTGGNTQIIAGWIFSAVFWTSWLSLMTVTQIGSFIPISITTLATALMVPIFIGALIGIFSGSG